MLFGQVWPGRGTAEQREYLRQRDKALRATFPVFIADFWNDAPYVGGCIAGGRNYFHINAKGDVEPCVFCHTAVDSVYDKRLPEVLTSDYFQAIRSYQPHSDNMLTPCMIIDNPHIYREVVQRCGARPTHEGAEDLLVKVPEELDRYSQQVHQYFDPVWQQEKGSYGYDEAIDLPDPDHGTPSVIIPDNDNGTGRRHPQEDTPQAGVATESIATTQ